jgi:hypothetical protein
VPPIPTPCQGIDAQVTALETAAATLRADAQASVGQTAWTKLGQLGQVLQDLDRKQAELSTCIAAHSGDVVYEVVFIDGGGGPVAGDRVAHLWDMGASPPTRAASVPVQGGSFAFAGPLPGGNIAVAVEASAAAAGPDFRSGPMPVPPAGSAQRIEIVVGPTVMVTPDDLTRWLGNVSFTARRIDTGVGTFEVTLTSLAAALAPDTITLTGVGTVSLVAPTGGTQTSPFSASITVAFVPSTTPAAIVPIEPKKIGNPVVQVGGPLAILGIALNAGLGFGLWDVVLNQVRDIARDEAIKATATAISLAKLPADTTVSLRSMAIDATGIRFQPMLGALGTALSTYQPAAADIL